MITFALLASLAFAPTAHGADLVVESIDPNSCSSGIVPLSTNEFARWPLKGCKAEFENFVTVVNATSQCLVLNWDGHADRSLVPNLEGGERVSTAINTAHGVQACQPACSVTYAFQPEDRSTLIATGYRLPMGVPPDKVVIAGAPMLLYSTQRLDAATGVRVALMATPVATYRQDNYVGQLGGDKVVFSQQNSPCTALLAQYQ